MTESTNSVAASLFSAGILAAAAAGLYYLGTQHPDWETARKIRRDQVRDSDDERNIRGPTVEDEDDNYHGSAPISNGPVRPSGGGTSGADFSNINCSASNGTCAHGCGLHETSGDFSVRKTDSYSNSSSIVNNNITYNIHLSEGSQSSSDPARLSALRSGGSPYGYGLHGGGAGSYRPANLPGSATRDPPVSYYGGTYGLSGNDGTTNSDAAYPEQRRLMGAPSRYSPRDVPQEAYYDSDDEGGSELDYKPDRIQCPTTSRGILLVGLGPESSPETHTAGALTVYDKHKSGGTVSDWLRRRREGLSKGGQRDK